MPRSDTARQHVSERHESIENLWGAELDGLIVTGTEPRAVRLRTSRIGRRWCGWWTGQPTARLQRSGPASPRTPRCSVWTASSGRRCLRSCPASSSALKAADHPLVNDRSAPWVTPHSRHNSLPEEALAARGYRILGRSPIAGVDLFVKHCGSLFVFLQGHPEYDSGALLREYRRDVARYLAGTDARYPELPQGYFDAPASAALLRFRERALRRPDPALLAEFPSGFAAEALRDPWRPAAIRLYANWLAYLAAQRPREAGRSAADAAMPAYG